MKNDVIKIEHGIPVSKQPPRASKYPFDKLAPGDSFFVPGKSIGTVGGSLSLARRRTGYHLVARTEHGGVRVWRVGKLEKEGK